jgi:hypothetical protein
MPAVFNSPDRKRPPDTPKNGKEGIRWRSRASSGRRKYRCAEGKLATWPHGRPSARSHNALPRQSLPHRKTTGGLTMKMLHSRVSIVTIGAAAAFAASSIIASSALCRARFGCTHFPRQLPQPHGRLRWPWHPYRGHLLLFREWTPTRCREVPPERPGETNYGLWRLGNRRTLVRSRLWRDVAHQQSARYYRRLQLISPRHTESKNRWETRVVVTVGVL